MQDSLQIRPARPDDAERAAALLFSAYTHTHVTFPLQEQQGSGWLERLRSFFRQDDNRFSYQNTQVAELNSEVVGLILSFGGREEVRLNAAVGSWLEREAHDDEWYIDALAVFSNRGRQGIGTRLLYNAEQQARLHQYPKIALYVAKENQATLNLYTQLHYRATKQTFLYQRPHIRMVKTIDFPQAIDL